MGHYPVTLPTPSTSFPVCRGLRQRKGWPSLRRFSRSLSLAHPSAAMEDRAQNHESGTLRKTQRRHPCMMCVERDGTWFLSSLIGTSLDQPSKTSPFDHLLKNKKEPSKVTVSYETHFLRLDRDWVFIYTISLCPWWLTKRRTPVRTV